MNNFNIDRNYKKLILFFVDSVFAFSSFIFSSIIVTNSFDKINYRDCIILIFSYQIIAVFFKNYRIINKYYDVNKFFQISLFYFILFWIYIYLSVIKVSYLIGFLSALFTLILLISSRKFYIEILKRRFTYQSDTNAKLNCKNIVIFGADPVNIRISKSLDTNLYKIIAFIDDDIDKHNLYVGNIKIISKPDFINFHLNKIAIDIILINNKDLNNIYNKDFIKLVRKNNILLRVINDDDLNNINVTTNELISMIFSRDIVEPDLRLMNLSLKDKTILITGAGGSIGSEIIRQAISYNPYKIIMLDSSEHSLFKIYSEVLDTNSNTKFLPILDSITNKKISKIFYENKIDSVYHAAAYKHVGLVELNPYVSLFNNIIGLNNVIQQVKKFNVKDFVLISTDKAVNPLNIMGLSKKICELITFNNSLIYKNTNFNIVRFGNVAGSSGSVIEIFKNKLSHGLPLTVTHKEATRFFMSIPEAAQLVIQSSSINNKGGIFILDMGEPIKIIDIAKTMLNNYKYFNSKIIITGLNPGEKINEQLTSNNKLEKTIHPKINIALDELEIISNLNELVSELESLFDNNADLIMIIKTLKKIYPYYDYKL